MTGATELDAPTVTGSAAVDRIARATLTNSGPFEVTVAESDAEREAAYRLRYECVVAQVWARPEQFPDGLEHDAYDDEALQIVARDELGLAGTVRLVPPRAGRPLPLEEAYELEIEPRGRVVDGGRLVIAERHRGKQGHAVLALLFARFWLETRALGFDAIAAVAPSGVVELYRGLGLDVTVLGPPRDYWGDLRHPLRIAGTENCFSEARDRLGAR